jgi:archaeal type IV pilus assembly protein PilA
MDFKKLFRKDDNAVSPVIGVILMVAITVILAAAIGSSVFSKGTAESAPQANFNVKAGTLSATADTSSIKIEHLGGDDVHFEGTPATTKVVATFKDKTYNIGGATTELAAMKVGDTKTLVLKSTDTSSTFPGLLAGDTVNIKFIDTQTNQLLADKNVRF